MAEPHPKLQHHHAHKNMYSTRESVARVANSYHDKSQLAYFTVETAFLL